MADEEVVIDEQDEGVEGGLTADLESAWEEVEGVSEANASDGAGHADTGAGSGDVIPADGGGEDDAAAAGVEGGQAAGVNEAEHLSPRESEGGKPPLDWSPELREEWAGLPEGVKSQIVNRESQMAQAMQGTSQARRVAQEFTGVANRYGSVMAAEGVNNPVQMFDTVMRTVSELRMGTTQQKAAKMADLIQNYGIDIQSLDDALAGTISGEPQATSGNPDMEAMLNERMAPVNDMMQQLAGMQQQKQQASAYEAQNEVNAFSQNAEFLDVVRHDVADLINSATRQGRDMSLEEAYNKACVMNPQIASVMDQRAQREKLAGNQRGVEGKRNAGSSLRPGNSGGNSAKAPNTLYEQISAAWDEQLGG